MINFKSFEKRALILLIYLGGLAYAALLAVISYKSWVDALLFVIGLPLCYFFTALMHECGHLLLAKLFGFKAIGFSVGFLHFSFKNGKTEFKFGFSDYAGETDVIPIKDGNFVKRYRYVILGGLIGGLLAVLILALLYYIFAFYGLIASLFVSFPISIAAFAINSLPSLISSSDGAVLRSLSYKENAECAERYLEILYNLYCGKTFTEMDESLFTIPDKDNFLYEEILLVNLMLAEERDDEEQIGDILELSKGVENSFYDFDREIAFAGCVLGDIEQVEGLKRIVELSYALEDINSQRLRLYYSKLAGDIKYVEIAKPTALKACKEWYLKGEAKFNEKMIERI